MGRLLYVPLSEFWLDEVSFPVADGAVVPLRTVGFLELVEELRFCCPCDEGVLRVPEKISMKNKSKR